MKQGGEKVELSNKLMPGFFFKDIKRICKPVANLAKEGDLNIQNKN
jgi:hypothetical protein